MGGRREDAREERQEVSFRLLPGGELSDEEEEHEEEEGDVTPRAVQLHSVREEKEPKEGRWVRHFNLSSPVHCIVSSAV